MFESMNWSQKRLVTVSPFILRLTFCIFSFFLCAVFWHMFRLGIIWVLPISLSAWYFKHRGVGICFCIILTLILLFNGTRLGSPGAIVVLTRNTIILLASGFLLCWLRQVADTIKAARQQAKQGNNALLDAHEQLNKLNLLKQQFLVNINHELRTPLTAVYSYIEYLQIVLEQQGQLTQKEHAHHIQEALHSCEELRVMVNQAMTIMELESSGRAPQTEAINAQTLLTDALNQIPVLKQQRHRIRLNAVQPLMLAANATYLRHIFYHLLSNALKYSPPDTPIVITCEPYGKTQEQVCISIQDRGPGIPEKEIPYIFEDFVRLQRDVAGVIRGPGLGLSISKRLVEMMQGQIWVESTGIAGQGSCFRFILPRVMPRPSIITQVLPESRNYRKDPVYAGL